MRTLLRFAMLALVLVLVALAAALTTMRLAIHGQEVAVPALVGLTPTEAERQLSGVGLPIEIERKYYSAQIPEGRIMSQLPSAGIRVRRGWQVRVAQSLGPMRIAIPDVTGESEHAAELNLQRRGLDVVSTAQMQTADVPANRVLAQSPSANATQVSAPKISLLLATSADAPTYVMPSFVGQPLGSASRTLQDSGFRMGNVTAVPPPDVNNAQSGDSSAPSETTVQPVVPAQPTPASIIVSQTPAAGQKVAAGATVSFEVR